MQLTGIKFNVMSTIKRLILSIIICFLFFEPAISASALEGLAKFENKKDATVFLEVAVTAEEKAIGLMNRASLAQNRGMVFVFRPPTKVTFWMKDTLIPLDMIFINRGKIVKIVKGAIPNQTNILYPSDFEVTEVVEVNSGFSDKHLIEVGNTVRFENIAAIDYSKKSKLMVAPK